MPRKRTVDDDRSKNFSITVRCSTLKLYDHFLNENTRIPATEHQTFATSPFRQFLRLETEERLKILTSIITEIVSNRVGRLKYAFEGRVLEFKMTDLALIMGPLKFGNLPVDFAVRKPTEYSEFRKRYFPNNLHIQDQHILNALVQAREDVEADKDDVNRLNRLYFLAVFLLPDSSKTIDVRYVDLAENLDSFDEFPWGTACFKLFESTLEDVYRKIVEGVQNYCMNGCLFAFIVWAYQHLPDLGPRRLPDSPFPRMLGWHDLPTRNKSAKKISEKFHPKKGFINLAYPLDITLEERVAANLQSVEEFQALVQVEYEESSTSRPVLVARPSTSKRSVSNLITLQKDALETILKGVFEMVVVGLRCDAKISSLMKDPFFNRNIAESDTNLCHYYWSLAKDKKWWAEPVRVYGYNDGCYVKPYNTLYKDNWLDGEIINCYLKLFIRWYSTMRTYYFKDEDQYAIVATTYLPTKIKHSVRPLYNQLMKDKSFAKMKPQERVLSGRFKIDEGCSSMVDPWLGLLDQVHPVKAKALLIPLQVNGNHWMLTSFSFREGVVRIYDSLGSKRATQELKDLEQFLPYVLYAADPSQVEVKLDMKWRRDYVDCVQQEDGCSCGLFLLAYVECVLRGIQPNFNADPNQMRFRIARDLIDVGESPSSVKNKKK